MNIIQALSAVMEDVRSVGKGDRNSHGGYNFRGVDAVVNAVGPALRKHRVIVTPDVREFHHGEITTGKNRTPMGHARVIVAYTFHAEDGSTITCSAAAESFDSGDKATPKAMSVAFRTALLQALCLPTDEPDPDASSYERAAPEPSPRDVILTHHKGDFQAAIAAASRLGFDLKDETQRRDYAVAIKEKAA